MASLIMNKKIKIIKKLNKLEEKYDGSWIGGHAHTAFLVSLGVGSWKETRIFNVQKYALEWFYSYQVSDLRHIPSKREEIYPLSWQNKYLYNMIDSLKEEKDLFEALCLHWKISNNWKESLEDLFRRCGARKKGSKALWMFARDYLNIPSFPIDKITKITLEKYKLPVCPWEMVELCQEAEVSPNALNRKMFLGANTDWSEH